MATDPGDEGDCDVKQYGTVRPKKRGMQTLAHCAAFCEQQPLQLCELLEEGGRLQLVPLLHDAIAPGARATSSKRFKCVRRRDS